MSAIHDNLKQIRMMKKMTQEEVAEKIGLTRQAVSSYENGKRQPGMDILMSLAELYEVELETILYGIKEREKGRRRVKRAAFIWSGIFLTLQMVFGLLHTLANSIMPIEGKMEWSTYEPPGEVQRMFDLFDAGSKIEIVMIGVLCIGGLLVLILDLKEKYTYSAKTILLYCFGFLGISLFIAFFWGMIDSKFGFKGYFWRGPVYFYHVVLYCVVDIIVTVRKNKKHNEKR